MSMELNRPGKPLRKQRKWPSRGSKIEDDMEIRFTEDELRIIAKLVTEELQKELQNKINKVVLGPYMKKQEILADKTVFELVRDGELSMSTGLYNTLQAHLSGYTFRQLAEARWIDFGRIRGLGRKKYWELTQLFREHGLKEGTKKIKYDHTTMRYKIVE